MARSKGYKTVKEKAPTSVVSASEAISFIKGNPRAKFDETVELHIRLGVDPSKSDQAVRGSVVLPHGTPKQKTIVVFTEDSAKQKAAEAAGAAQVGGQALIDQIASEGGLDADVTIASPDMMPKVAKIAKILGPKGLMPNPKTGTVTPNVEEAVKELVAGKLAFKMDQLGNIHESVAKLSWEAEKIQENLEALVDAIRAARPASQKGEFLSHAVLATTMGPAVRLSL
ncbi:MAG: 50S ribosomal protein L1 [Candidatus Andersenbacteria bacterium]